MSLFKSTAWYTFGNMLSRSLGFILLPFYSNLLGTGDFGIYALIMSAYSVLAAIYQGGLFSGFSKYYVEAEDKNKNSVFSAIFFLILISGIILSEVITVYQNNFSSILLSSPGHERLIFIAAWMLFFDTVFSTLTHLLKTKEQSTKVAYYTSVYAIFNLMLNVFFVFYQRKGVEGILLAQLFSGAIVSASMFPIIVENISFRFNSIILKKILVFSFPLLIGGIFSTLVDVVDRFILDHFFDVKTVGIYSFSYRIAMVMNVFVISFGTAWTPYFLRIYNKEKTYSSLFGRNFTKLIAISTLIFLSVSLLIDDLFNLHFSGINLFNSQYESGIIIIPIILLAYGLRGLIGFYSVYPYVSGKSYHFLVSDLLAFVFNVVLNYILIPKWGIMGAAFATLLSYSFGLVYLFMISREINILYQGRELSRLLLSVLLIYIVAQYFNYLILDIVLIISYTIIIQRLLKVGTPQRTRTV